MLSSALTDDANTKLTRVVSALLALAVKHKRSSVRAVGCLMWRCAIWVYFQGRLPPLDDGEGESKAKDGVEKNTEKGACIAKQTWWKVVTTVVELNTGVCTIAALLSSSGKARDTLDEDNDGADEDEHLQRMLEVLQHMVGKTNSQIVTDVLETLKHLLGVSSYNSIEQAELEDYNCSPGYDEDQEQRGYHRDLTPKLLPHSLFSSLPGLLSVEFKALSTAVRPVFEETAGPEDVRALTRGEVARGSTEPDTSLDVNEDMSTRSDSGKRKKDGMGSWWMWEGLVRIWRRCVISLWEGEWVSVAAGKGEEKLLEREKEVVRRDLVSVWEALVGMGVGFLQGSFYFSFASSFMHIRSLIEQTTQMQAMMRRRPSSPCA